MRTALFVKVIIVISLVAMTWKVIAGDASVSVSVKDEQGSPVPGAEVTAVWYGIRPAGTGWGNGDQKKTSGLSDMAGQCSLSVGGDGGVIVRKEGYYWSGSGDEYHKQFTAPLNSMNKIDISIILVKKINPVPMYVRDIRSLEIPELGIPIGFDLVEGAWVKPYGKGIHGDMSVLVVQEVRARDDMDRSFTVKFSGDMGGIQMANQPLRTRGCELRLPREAPADGYVKEFEKNEFRRPGGQSKIVFNENANFIFRLVREMPDVSDGTSGLMYGKIHGDIVVGGGGMPPHKPAISFRYYLNPSGSRSLEWDTAKNLVGPNDPQGMVPRDP